MQVNLKYLILGSVTLCFSCGTLKLANKSKKETTHTSLKLYRKSAVCDWVVAEITGHTSLDSLEIGIQTFSKNNGWTEKSSVRTRLNKGTPALTYLPVNHRIEWLTDPGHSAARAYIRDSKGKSYYSDSIAIEPCAIKIDTAFYQENNILIKFNESWTYQNISIKIQNKKTGRLLFIDELKSNESILLRIPGNAIENGEYRITVVHQMRLTIYDFIVKST